MAGREAAVREPAREAAGFDAGARDAGLWGREAIARVAGWVEADLDAAAAGLPRFAALAVAGRDVGGRVAPRLAGDRAPPAGAFPGGAPAARDGERPAPRAGGAAAGRGAGPRAAARPVPFASADLGGEALPREPGRAAGAAGLAVFLADPLFVAIRSSRHPRLPRDHRPAAGGAPPVRSE